MGHVQDTPVSTSMISNVCMICHMKVHMVSYDLGPPKISKSKIHILPNYEQTDLKTALVRWVLDSPPRTVKNQERADFTTFIHESVTIEKTLLFHYCWKR